MTSNVLDQATRLYVFVAEVLAVGLMQGSLGVATLRKTYAMIRDNIGPAFPCLPGYKQWVRRLHALAFIAGRLVEAAFTLVALSPRAGPVRLYLLDPKPVPICKPIRHGLVRLMREDGAYFGKTSAGWFSGFKLHVIAHVSGAAFFKRMLDESVVAVVTPRDAAWGSDEQRTLSGVRERVDTTLRQLWDRFCDRVYARSWEGLWSVSLLKLVHRNLCYAGIASI